MTDNPYAPPKAEVVDVPLSRPSGQRPIYFPTSVLKMLVLNFGTFGLYQVYWFYKNWNLHKQRTGEKISPAARSIFGVFYCYALNRVIRDQAKKAGTATFPAGASATAWIIISLLGRLPDPYWLITFASVFALLPAQLAVNE